MRRLHLFEWEDQPWFPHLWRNYLTDVLQYTFTQFAPRMPIVNGLIGKLLDRAGTDRIVDLCSGSTGPLLWFRQRLEEERGRPVYLLLTDRYPNLDVFEAVQAGSNGRVSFCADSIDATSVPDNLVGVRTMFLAFHHFRPEAARRILETAAAKRQAIAVFDVTERSVKALLATPLFPVVALLVTPFVRPFRLERLFWTYVLPVVPLGVFWDGLVSCLRTYTVVELKEITASIGVKDYAWEIGRARVTGTPAQVTYLAGYPTAALR